MLFYIKYSLVSILFSDETNLFFVHDDLEQPGLTIGFGLTKKNEAHRTTSRLRLMAQCASARARQLY
jgi:hypothetical protein